MLNYFMSPPFSGGITNVRIISVIANNQSRQSIFERSGRELPTQPIDKVQEVVQAMGDTAAYVCFRKGAMPE